MTCPLELVRDRGGSIGLFVLDGLGGLPHADGGKTELEAANTPQLDALAKISSLGRIQLLPPGITPGSGPGHMSLFGHDPMQLEFGRGLLEALGSDYPLATGEIAARGNFCSIDEKGLVSDRRAGRPSDEECHRICELLMAQISLDGVQVRLLAGKQHRFTWVITGDALGAAVNDNDPQVTGREPLPLKGRGASSERTALLATEWIRRAREVLATEQVANGVLLRGFSSRPDVPTFEQLYNLRSGAIAIYPMYRGVAKLVGMDSLDAGNDLKEQAESLSRAVSDGYDFLFVHHKDTDTAGHSGDFDAKVAARGLGPIEQVRQRHHVKNKTLFPFMQSRTVLRFTTLAGDVLQGLVGGIHRYELTVLLKGGVPVTLMRHAIFDVRDKKGVCWLKEAVLRRGSVAPQLPRR